MDSTRTHGLRWGLVFALAVLLMTPAPARAQLFESGESLLMGYSVTGGAIYEAGRGELSGWRDGVDPTPIGYGFRYFERNGLISGTIGAIAVVLGGAMAASGPKSVETWEDSNYRYTKTTYYSAAEQAAITGAAAQSASDMMGSPNQSFDLQVFSRSLGGTSAGYKANLMFVGIPFEGGMFDVGMGLGKITSAFRDKGQYFVSRYTYFGMPMRLNFAMGPVVTYLHFDWNWLSHAEHEAPIVSGAAKNTKEVESDAFPWRLGLQAALFGRLYLDAAATTPSLTSGDFGYSGSLGLRF
jgi:hypothetical protein